jgi:hypothetical protein
MKPTKKVRTETPRTRADVDPGPVVGLGLASAIYFGLAIVFFLPAFLPGNHIYGTDYLVGGYHFHEFISQRFSDGDLPKWVPYVYGGLPIFANPGSSYHPVRFLGDALFHTSRIWPTFFVVHFTLAGIGTYLLARELKLRSWVALVAGLAFQFTGITMSWVLGGHEGRIIVATLTPLAFYFYHRGIRTGDVAPFVGAAATLVFALLTFQIQSSYYLLLAAGIWAVFGIWTLGAYGRKALLARVLVMGLLSVVFAFAVASVNFLPFMDYVEASPRAGEEGRGYEYSISFSMPPREITALAVPEDVGFLETYRGTNPFKLHTEYAGMTAVALFALGFLVSRRNRYWWFFLGLAVFALTISFGGHTPIYRLYYELLPGTKRFRAPAISFFLVSFSLVMMAAIALDHLAAWRERRAARLREEDDGGIATKATWILAGLVGVLALGFLAAASGMESADPAARPRALGFGRSLLFLAVVAAGLWAWLHDRLRTTAVVVLLSIVTVADLWIIDRRFFQTVESPEVMYAPDDVVHFLARQPGRDRVWVFPIPQGAVYRNHGNYLMRFGIDQTAGEHGNQLQRWNEYLGAGQEVYVDWHNFLTDVRVVETPEGRALAFQSVPGFLEGANIRYIVSMVPLANPHLREVHRGSALIYEHVGALPRAYLVPSVETAPTPFAALSRMAGGWDPRELAVLTTEEPIRLPAEPLDGSAEIVEYTPDRVVVRARANRPAVLILADNHYPDWNVEVNGVEGRILAANHTMRGVVLDEGDHTVTFTFTPADLIFGFWLYLAGMILLLGYGAYQLVLVIRSRRVAHPAA